MSEDSASADQQVLDATSWRAKDKPILMALPLAQLGKPCDRAIECRALFEHSLDAILFTDAQARITAANPAAGTLFAMPEPDFRGRSLCDLIDSSDGRIRELLSNPARSGGIPLIELAFVRKDGIRFPGELTSVSHDDGRQAIITIRDITRRKAVEVELEARERYLRTVLQTAGDGFWVLAPDGRILEVNDAACQMSGYSPAELLGMYVHRLDANECGHFVADRIARIMEHGSDTFETRHRRKDGSVYDVEIVVKHLEMHGDRLVCFCRDITARKQAEEQIRATLESIGDGLAVYDAYWRLIYINAAGERLLGVRREEVLHRRLEDLFPDLAGTAMHEEFRCAAAGQSREFDHYCAPTGRWFHCRCFPHPGGGVSNYFQEITEKKLAELEQAATAEMLRLANTCRTTAELVEAAIGFFQRESGCEAVGIRLSDGEDYPYYQTSGFDPGFVMLENELCARNDAGEIVRDACGNPALECMCGHVICGRFNPALPCFTASGTFWTNSTSELLACTPPSDSMGRTRNRCNGQGYESVALFPLRVGENRLGLLQLNDTRRGRFTPRSIALWERLASGLAVALATVRADEALQKSEERLRLALRATHDVVWDWDVATDTIQWGASVAEVFGWSELVDSRDGMAKCLEQICSEDHQRVVKHFMAALDDPACLYWEDEYRSLRKDGSFADVHDRAFIVRNENGKARRMVGSIQDLTRRNRDEQQLRLQSLVLDQIADRVTVTDLQGIITYVNTAECAGLRRPREDLVGKSIDVFGEDAARGATQQEIVQRTLSDGKWRGPVVNRAADAGEMIIDLRTTLVRDHAGRPIAMCGVGTDITARKRAEDAMRDALWRMENIIEGTRAATWEWNVQTGEVVFNRIWAALVGYTLEELNPLSLQTWEKLAHPDDVRTSMRLLEEHFAGRLAYYDCECRMKHKDGHWIWVHDRGRVVTWTSDGKPLMMFGTHTDITSRKLAEEALQAHQREIAHLSRVASVGEMASSLAHELNQPLAAIVGYATACQNASRALDCLPPKVSRYLEEIAAEADRAAGIVRRVRGYVKKEPPERRPLAINDTVREAVELLRQDMMRCGVALELSLAPEGPLLLGDAVEIQQVLCNLMQNAVDAMHGDAAGPRRLLLHTSLANQNVQVRVIDTGPAVPAELRSRIFEAFFTTKPQGLGLGLSICRSIVESHGGQIIGSANPDRGMTFEFTLPAFHEG